MKILSVPGRAASIRERAAMVMANFAATGLFLAMSPLLARAMRPSGRGIFAMVQVLTAVAPTLLGLGSKDAAGWAEARGITGRSLVKRILRQNRSALLALAVIVSAGGIFLAFARPQFVAVGLTALFLAAITPQIFESEAILGQWTARGSSRRLAFFFLAPAALQVLCFVVLLHLHRLEPVTAAVSLLLSTGFGILFRLRVESGDRPFDNQDADQVVEHGRKWWPGLLSATVLSRLDAIFLALFAPPAVLGIYSVASTASLLGQPVLPALVQKILRAAHAARPEYARFHATVLGFLLPCAGIVAALGYVSIPALFGRAYSDSSEIFAILCGAALAVLSGNMSAQALGAIGRAKLATNAIIVWLLVGFGTLIAFLPLTEHSLGIATAVGITVINIGLAATLFTCYQRCKRAFDTSAENGVRMG